MSCNSSSRLLLYKGTTSGIARPCRLRSCPPQALRVTSRRSSSSLLRRSNLTVSWKPLPPPLSWQQHCKQCQRYQQRRSYLFLPSDIAEMKYRFKLWWNNNNTPTKIKIKLQDRYQLSKRKMKDSYQTSKDNIKSKYNTQKDHFKSKYNIQKDNIQNQYNMHKSNIQTRYKTKKDQLKIKRNEFTKRWTARKSDLLKDSSDMMKNYIKEKQSKHQQMFTVTEYCEKHWFSSIDGRPLTSYDPTGRFVNPWQSWSTNGVHSLRNIIKWRYHRALRQWKERGIFSFIPKDLFQLLFEPAIITQKNKKSTSSAGVAEEQGDKPRASSTGQEDEKQTAISTSASSTDIQFTWIGHSTCLVQMGNANILTDPIFSHRCTPFQRLPGVGVARDIPPSIGIAELPEVIHICMISHDHYDHLDQLSILHLRDRVQYWVVPKGIPEWLETRCSIDPTRMIELEWWESVHMIRSDNNKQQQQQQEQKLPSNAANIADAEQETNERPSTWQVNPNLLPLHDDDFHQQADTMTITCLPAQHWSSRTFFDRCKRLWCGFSVETQTYHQQHHSHPSVQNIVDEQLQLQQEQDEPIVQKFYFAGDTGMPSNGFPLFRQIGDFCGRGMYHHNDSQQRQQATASEENKATAESSIVGTTFSTSTSATTSSKFHPFDLAAIPIGAYDPPFLMQEAHMNPKEAVECSKQLHAKRSVAIHWGTFALSEEPLEEPPKLLEEVLCLEENDDVDFAILPIGGTMRVSGAGSSSSEKNIDETNHSHSTTATTTQDDDETEIKADHYA